jgi:hypothetical protein
MSLTAHYVSDSRQVIAEVEAADITSPDLPRVDVVVLVTRLTETLRTTATHAERLGQSNTQLRKEIAELESQVRALHEALRDTQAAA